MKRWSDEYLWHFTQDMFLLLLYIVTIVYLNYTVDLISMCSSLRIEPMMFVLRASLRNSKDQINVNVCVYFSAVNV